MSAPLSTGGGSPTPIAGAVTRSLWLDRLDPPPQRRPPLDGDVDVDVAIVGGGFSGLWTAYYLIRTDPTLRVAVLERHHCGFGASGRNGGWAIGELAGGFASYAKRSSPQEALRLTRAVFESVDEIARVAGTEAIECDFAKGGTVRVARTAPQAERQRTEIAEHHRHGLTEDDIRLLSAEEARARVGATEVRSGIFFTHTAALDPAKLVEGLASTVTGAGVAVYEGTTVRRVPSEDAGQRGGRAVVETDRGVVRAGAVVVATEAYTRDLPGHRLDLLPIYSLMIATEPLPPSTMAELGLVGRPTFADDRHLVIYGQRTADDRIAFGAPGIPYLFGSRISAANETRLASHETIRDILVELFPALADVAITHRWGGVLGIPRDWRPGLRFDPTSGVGALGGYVGEGVAASNLAGRTMADLVLGHDTDRTSLPWVGVRARRWEPEPLRWVGVRGSRTILAAADRREAETDRPADAAFRLSRLLRGGN